MSKFGKKLALGLARPRQHNWLYCVFLFLTIFFAKFAHFKHEYPLVTACGPLLKLVDDNQQDHSHHGTNGELVKNNKNLLINFFNIFNSIKSGVQGKKHW
jgi:hypothetical protein